MKLRVICIIEESRNILSSNGSLSMIEWILHVNFMGFPSRGASCDLRRAVGSFLAGE